LIDWKFCVVLIDPLTTPPEFGSRIRRTKTRPNLRKIPRLTTTFDQEKRSQAANQNEAKRRKPVYNGEIQAGSLFNVGRLGLMATMMAEGVSAPGELALEERARAIGREVFRAVGRGSSPLERGWWDDRAMALTMGDARVKVQLFRFIDALPALTSAESVGLHLREYLDQADDVVPWFMKLGVGLAPVGSLRGSALAWLARFSATHMARKFIAGSTPAEAFETVKGLRHRAVGFTADLLGEAVISDAEAEAYQATCIELVRGLAPRLAAMPEEPRLDASPFGPIPRVNLSLKLTSLTPRFDALYAESTTRRVAERLRPILRVARENGAFVNVDMEQYAHKDLTYAIFREVLSEPEFRDWTDVGIVCQAYLPEAEGDLRNLEAWVRERGTPITIRLVKGAYWDYEVTHARQMGWPVPVYLQKWQSDASFERCAWFLMANFERLRPALGSHNIRSLSLAMAAAEALGVPDNAYEIQILHGMGRPIERAMIARGRRVRVYTPYGAMLPGMAYLVRRLLENTSNESFLKASFAGGAEIEELLRNPEEIGSMLFAKRRNPATIVPVALPRFENEPFTDFTRPDARARMKSALEEVRNELKTGPYRLPLVIDGKEQDGVETLEVTSPGDSSIAFSSTAAAGVKEADQAVEAARIAFESWSMVSPRERAGVLIRAASILRRDRFKLNALEVYECGKPWREADGDIAEAIDFCEFYAREMIRLAEPQNRDVPGETNSIERIPRGVVVVIPPWNFPLAIPMGMVAAAVVAGNPVILKPAEQSPVMGWHLFRIMKEAGLPSGVLQFLPGRGEIVGQALVDDPCVDLISFTGSRAVGLEINRRASDTKPGQDHVKRVIAEMGGKNALIIDEDADLDEAVVGLLQSAFGYSGQKCSACSRAIVLDGVYDAFVARLAEAAKSVVVGPPEDPETVVGPVIDADAKARILRYGAIARTEGRIVHLAEIGSIADRGHYVGPMIVADVAPKARIAQEEIFGPILAVIRAGDLDEALKIANGTEYALTGGLYSRSPANIDKVKRVLRVGNIYINRPITGALVDRQPFGGFKLSGIGGSKAGGSSYLEEFLLTRAITENTLRRGFAPEDAEPAREVAGAIQ
jgi:RHH-type proline utilization regulon transcriptional repressor/proline dehydrogenase/delta 1-pyrroline-5-carboxylate dehydrogenase